MRTRCSRWWSRCGRSPKTPQRRRARPDGIWSATQQRRPRGRSGSRVGGPGADGERALFLSRRGGRLTSRAALDVFTAITAHAGLEDAITAHVGRPTFVTRLIRGGEDFVTVAVLAGHARLETLKVCGHLTEEDEHSALRHLTVDR